MIKINLKSLNKVYTNITSSSFIKVFTWDILSKGADFAILPIYLKILSQEEYGLYTYLLYIITSIANILKLGIDTAVSKMYYETEKYNRSKMLFSANSLWVAFFIAFCGVSFFSGFDKILFCDLLNVKYEIYIKINIFIFVFIFFNLIQNTLNVFFVINEDANTYQRYNLLRTIIGNGVIIGILFFFESDNKVNLRLSIEPFVYILSFFPLIYIYLKKMIFKIDINVILDSLKIGLPMVGTVVVGLFLNISDKYFLQKSHGYSAIAIYNLSIFLTLPVSLIFNSFQTVWFPKFLQMKSYKLKYMYSNKYAINLFFLFILILLLVWLVIFFCINFKILPKEYTSIIYFFPLVFISKIAENLSHLYNNFIVIWGKTYFNFITSVSFSAVIILLNYLIIPGFGIWGAVFVFLLLSITRIIVFFFYVKKNLFHKIF